MRAFKLHLGIILKYFLFCIFNILTFKNKSAFLGDAKGIPLLFSGLVCISLGTEKIRLTLDYQSEGHILLPWVLWIPVFKKLQVKVRELWKQVLKREKRKYVDYTKSRITGFASWSCLRLLTVWL